MKVFSRNEQIDDLKCKLAEDDLNKIVQNCFQIEGIDNSNDKLAIYLFLQAISMVGIDYIEYNYEFLDMRTGGKRKKLVQKRHLERTFTYELYRIWQNLVKLYMTNIRVDAEIGKKITYQGINNIKLGKLKGDSKIPDFVLHASQGNTDNHTIICEVKRDENLCKTKIKYDIVKICRYMDTKIWNEHPYKFGCFILASKDRDEESFNKAINLMKDELMYFKDKISFNHLFCIIYDGHEVKYDTLKNILNI